MTTLYKHRVSQRLEELSDLTNLFYKLSKNIEDKIKIVKLYMNWLKSQPCVVSGSRKIERHHLRYGAENCGTGMKPDDIFCIPLSSKYHTGNDGIHHYGNKKFEDKFNLSLTSVLIKLHNKFIREVLKG